jgi:NAD(P)-dependent dehydrogenase (short-subunit alcohol dehydrogenase family)
MPPTGPVDLKSAINFDSLKDRNVLITGGASGLGKHMVQVLAQHGANIVIGDVQEEAGKALEQELSASSKGK